jgi:hypothetical protein
MAKANEKGTEMTIQTGFPIQSNPIQSNPAESNPMNESNPTESNPIVHLVLHQTIIPNEIEIEETQI